MWVPLIPLLVHASIGNASDPVGDSTTSATRRPVRAASAAPHSRHFGVEADAQIADLGADRLPRGSQVNRIAGTNNSAGGAANATAAPRGAFAELDLAAATSKAARKPVQGAFAELEQHTGKAHAHAAMKAELYGVEVPGLDNGAFFSPEDWRKMAIDGALPHFASQWQVDAPEEALAGANPADTLTLPQEDHQPTNQEEKVSMGWVHTLKDPLHVDGDGKAQARVSTEDDQGAAATIDAGDIIINPETSTMMRQVGLAAGTKVRVVPQGGLTGIAQNIAWWTGSTGSGISNIAQNTATGAVKLGSQAVKLGSEVLAQDDGAKWLTLLADMLRAQVLATFPQETREGIESYYKSKSITIIDKEITVQVGSMPNTLLHGHKVSNANVKTVLEPKSNADLGGCFFLLDPSSRDYVKEKLGLTGDKYSGAELILTQYWESGTLLLNSARALQLSDAVDKAKNFYWVSSLMSQQINYIGVNIDRDRDWLWTNEFNTANVNRGANTAIAVTALKAYAVKFE